MSAISETTSTEEDHKIKNLPFSFNKFDHDLYQEDDDITYPIFRVKRIATSNKIERWKFYQDSKVVFTLEGSKISKKEKEFLRTIDGVNFLLVECKKGIKSLNSLKIEIKKKLK